MKHFVNKIFQFILPAVFICVFTILYYVFYKEKVNKNFNRIADFECLILGDSQMQRIDPEIFNCATYNLASAGEHYFFTYYKLKKILRVRNHKVKNVVLGVSMHNFAPVYNRLFDLGFSEGQSSLLKYIYFIDVGEITLLKNKKELLSKSLLEGIYRKPNWGGFHKSSNQKPDSLLIMQTLKMHYKIKSTEEKFSEEQIKYLNLIDSLCKSNNINLYLVSTPYHSLYLENVEPYYKRKLQDVIRNMENPNYINFLDSLVNPYLFSDGNHLNYAGSKIYSEKINEIMDSLKK